MPFRELFLHPSNWGQKRKERERKEKGRERTPQDKETGTMWARGRKCHCLECEPGGSRQPRDGALGLAGVGPLRLASTDWSPTLYLVLASWAGDLEARASVSPPGKWQPHAPSVEMAGRQRLPQLCLGVHSCCGPLVVKGPGGVLPALPCPFPSVPWFPSGGRTFKD